MKRFTSPLGVLCLQLLFPAWLCAQSTATEVPPIVDSLIQVSRAHTAATEFEEAFAVSTLAGEAAVECCGENSAAYASYCFNEGRIRYFMGSNADAIPWYITAKELRAELLGTMHVDYGKSLNNLAIVYDVMGDYAKAEPLYKETIIIREKTAGKESKAYSDALGNLGNLYSEMGDYEKAEIAVLEVLGIRKRLFGETDPIYAGSLQYLANIYYNTNNYNRALQLYQQAKAILEAQESLSYFDYVAVLTNLGAGYMALDDYYAAESHFQEAADLIVEVMGADDLSYAIEISKLGVVHHYTNRFEKSEELFQEALKIMGDAEQDGTLDCAYVQQHLSDLYESQGRFNEALSRQRAAVAILEVEVNDYHPRYLRGLRDLANLELELGNQEIAENLLRQLATLEETRLANATRHLSEDELANYTQDFKRNLNQYFTLAETSPDMVDVCYDKMLVYKGFLQNNALQIQQRVYDDTVFYESYQVLRGLHGRLAAKYAATTTNTEEVQALEKEIYVKEKELVKQNAILSDGVHQLNWKDIQRTLKPGSAALEFVEYENELSSTETAKHHGALLLLPNTKLPLFIPLCPTEDVDELLENTAKLSNVAFVNELYNSKSKGAELYQLLWSPIAEKLNKFSDVKTIHYAPGGRLYSLNLSAFPTPDGRTLSQDYELMALGSTRQLVRNSEYASPPDFVAKAMLYGGIDYGAPESLNTSIDQTSRDDQTDLIKQYPTQRAYDPELGFWQSLPWTEVEIITAEDLLSDAGYQPILRMQTTATEASVKELGREEQSPRVLHLATHGFFFPDAKEGKEGNQLAFRASERAMIRSGLVLADGNYAWAHGQPRVPGTEDGILTAYEVSKMNLRNTELVILSACETGLGDIKGTEGVYGLQRAFKIAGARYLIMTLWQVPDFQAQAFMTTFYLAWLEEGKTIPEAFLAAQNYMRARYKNAFDWAGFVLLE